MGEEGSANAASGSEVVVAPAENGSAPHDSNIVAERKTEEINGVKEEEDDKDEEKAETDKTGIVRDLKEEHDKKEQKEEEEPKTEEMEEEAAAEKKEEVPEEMKEDEENNEEGDKGIVDGVKHGGGEDEEIKEEKLGEEQEEEAEEEKKVEESGEKEQEKTESMEERTETEKAEQSTDEKGLKKRRRQKNAGGKAEGNKKQNDRTPRTPTVDRPVRERKSVERLVASIERDASKDFQIEKGRGTPLKDIPNVAFKLSRRKTDDTFKLLHNILFGRRGKAFQIKGNISRFSGFVWHDNEEKQKNKVKEKLDKCTKEKLLELCDVLDISVSKTSTRKEDIVAKLIDFLMAPHA